MKKRYYIAQIADYVGQEVTIQGWLYNIRTSGKLMFPQLRDGTGFIQGVVSQKEVSEKVWEDFHPGLKQFILKRVSDEQNAEDILQFSRVRSNHSHLKPHPSAFYWM